MAKSRAIVVINGSEKSEKRIVQDGNAIITSIQAINVKHWYDFVDKNWDQIMVQGTKTLVLSGVHGTPSGDLGPRDIGFVQEDIKARDKLLSRHATSQGVKIEVLDVGPVCELYNQHKSLELLKRDVKTAIEDMEKRLGVKFNTLLFSYCFTQWNILTDLLRLDSMCSRLILERDLFEVLGRRIIWSGEQRESLQWVRDHPIEPVVFTGDFGTGKTLLVTEAAKIKMAYYRTIMKKTVQLIVAVDAGMFYVRLDDDVDGDDDDSVNDYNVKSYLETCLSRGEVHIGQSKSRDYPFLLQDIMGNFSAWHKDITELVPERDPSAEHDIFSDGTWFLEDLLQTVRRLKKGDNKNSVKTIYVMDEINSVDLESWTLEDALKEDEDFVFAVQPPTLNLKGFGRLPKCLYLSRNYRNSVAIKKLYRHIASHYQFQCPELKLRAKNDSKNEEHPPGSTPAWITVDDNVTDDEVVDYLRSQPEYKDRLQEGHFQIADINTIGDDWKLRGSEWQTIVVLDNSSSFLMCSYLCEAITRARSHLFIISRINSQIWNGVAQVMHGAVDHDVQVQGESCPHCPDGKREQLLVWAFSGKTLTKNGNDQIVLRETELALELEDGNKAFLLEMEHETDFY